MGTPAVVREDLITGTCTSHLVPGPSGAQPAGPLPFSAPLTTGLATTVVIGGKPAAVQGASGINRPAHTGLHPNDPDQLSAAQQGRPPQQGRVVVGSATVFFDGHPAAFTGCTVTMCMGAPGKVAGTAATVLVAG
jgi:uncharacterized Zn-binding protein involved in type VI secretion